MKRFVIFGALALAIFGSDASGSDNTSAVNPLSNATAAQPVPPISYGASKDISVAQYSSPAITNAASRNKAAALNAIISLLLLDDSPPVISVSLSQPKVTVGSSVTLTWSSPNATSCVGMDSMPAGPLPISGSTTITPTVGGQFTYTISCNGVGGTTKNSALLIVPIPVLKTSYENKNRLDITDTVMPRADQLNGWNWPGVEDATSGGFNNRPFGIADFTEEGKFSVMTFQTRFSTAAMKAVGHADMPAKTYITQRNSSGTYMDITSKLIKNDADRYTCVTPSYAIVADFNNDQLPDVFVACTGLDYNYGPFDKNLTNSYQFAYISQPDGTYKLWKSDVIIYGHQCSAGDITGDGNVDVVCVDPESGFTQPFTFTQPITFVGNGRGGFTVDKTRFNLVQGCIFGIELVDLDGKGKLDVLLGGVTPNSDDWSFGWYNNVIIKNNGGGFFNVNSPVVLPTSISPYAVSQGHNWNYSAMLDVIVKDGYLYMLQSDYTGSYSSAIRKVNLANVADNTIIYETVNSLSGYQKTVNLIKPTADRYLVPIMICEFEKTDPLFATSACGVKVKM
jgi:hypothetical protein